MNHGSRRAGTEFTDQAFISRPFPYFKTSVFSVMHTCKNLFLRQEKSVTIRVSSVAAFFLFGCGQRPRYEIRGCFMPLNSY